MEALVLIASSIAAVRKRWRQALQGMYTIYEVVDQTALEQSMTKRKPTVLLLDLALSNLGGLGGLETLHQTSSVTKIILFTRTPNDEEGVAALMRGAKGYCHRNIDPALLRKAIKAIQKGEIWVGRRIIPHLLKELTSLTMRRQKDSAANPERDLDRLTPREREVAQLVSNGASNKEIATQLNITERTVKAHLTAIFRKLGVSDRLRLALLVMKFIQTPP